MTEQDIKKISKENIKKLLEKAIEMFLQKDIYLFNVQANERSITHKFAEYLQKVFGDYWNVDCEYNRVGDDIKKIEKIKDIVGNDTTIEGLNAKTVYPDIIIHKRGAEGPNLVVIEAKKDADNDAKKKDKEKLTAIKDMYKYEYAVFLDFITENKEINYELI